MGILALVHPDIQMEAKALEFKKEFFDNGEKTINGSNRLDMDKYSYPQWIEIVGKLNDNAANPVSEFSHTFFAVRDNEDVVGVVNIRHPLEGRFKDAGNIGYSVRPSERMKGYATEILRLSLEYAKRHGLTDVYLVCRQDNEASVKTIAKNGGQYCRTFVNGETEYNEYRIML